VTGRLQFGVLLAAVAMPLVAQHRPAAGANPQQSAAQTGNGNGGGQQFAPRHTGDWLRRHKDLPPAEQEKQLRNDPHFLQLPPERQQKLVERLHKFDSLSPEQKNLLLDRMHEFESMTPQQQQEFRGLQQKVKAMPPDRRQEIHKALRYLRGMPPEQRQQAIDSEQFKSRFSDDERDTLKQLMAIAPAAPEPTEPAQPQQH